MYVVICNVIQSKPDYLTKFSVCVFYHIEWNFLLNLNVMWFSKITSIVLDHLNNKHRIVILHYYYANFIFFRCILRNALLGDPCSNCAF